MDSVLIEGFEFETVIGVYEWEKRIHQRLSLDLELSWDITPAAQDDDLDKTLDYAAITTRIVEFANTHSFELVETYAERIATLVMQEFGVKELHLALRKPSAISAAKAVGVRIHRGQWNQSGESQDKSHEH